MTLLSADILLTLIDSIGHMDACIAGSQTEAAHIRKQMRLCLAYEFDIKMVL